MEASRIIDLADRFSHAGVAYMIAGGYAVVAHGYGRFTSDIDVFLRMDTDNLLKAFNVLTEAGFRPTVPVIAAEFADPLIRASWIRDKGMKVLNFHHPKFPSARVDLFVEEPFPFDQGLRNALVQPIGEQSHLVFVGLDELLEMKAAAGRPKDLIDIEYLSKYRHERADPNER